MVWISKKRNKYIQTVLIEVARLAPHLSPQLAEIHNIELAKGNRNRATLAVARKLVAYMLAVEKTKRIFNTFMVCARLGRLVNIKLMWFYYFKIVSCIINEHYYSDM